MMEWALAILFIVALVVLILSFINNRQASNAEKQKLDTMYLSFREEMNKLESQIRNVELDIEILTKESGLQSLEHSKLRVILDLYRRGYSIESIAAKEDLTVNEIEELLSPYLTSKEEGREE